MKQPLSQKDMLLKNIMKSESKVQNKVGNTATKGKLNTKGNIDVKAKNRKSQ
jgi:hypothetical protein